VLLGVEIARDLDRLVRRTGVESATIVGGGDGDRSDAELAARPEDPHGDLTSVRDQQLLDRHGATLGRKRRSSVV
jgi:hypothetical protein